MSKQGDIILSRDKGGIRTNVPHKLVMHSPTGFEFGYGGSGPADLALNILLLFTDEETAKNLHQTFKWEFIAPVPWEGGTISKESILNFIETHTESS